MSAEQTSLTPGAELICTVESLAAGGEAVAKPGGRVVFIDHGLPGEELRVRITQAKKNLFRAELIERLSDGPDRIAPPCPHAGRCGGCQWQHLSYPGQLTWKRRLVVDTLSRLGGLGKEAERLVEEAIPSPSSLHYRNKMEFHFRNVPEGRVLLGLMERQSHRVLEPTSCLLMDDPQPGMAMQVLGSVRNLVGKGGLPAWNPRQGKGFWRFLVLRFFHEPGNCAAHFITAPHAKGKRVLGAVARELLGQYPGLDKVAHSIRSHPAQVAYGHGRVRCWDREGECEPVQHESLLGLTVGVPMNGFMQVNTAAAELLFTTGLDWVREGEASLVQDLYCGCGALTMALGKAFPNAEVQGYELSREAVDAARANARANGVGNVSFRTGDVLASLPRESRNPDLVVVDPPRRGMEPELVELLLKQQPAHILAISCDPATLARDVKRLSAGYTLAKARPVDLFPQTSHVETISLLERR